MSTATWGSLAPIWRAAFSKALAAYLEVGSVPIGVVVVDGAGQLVSRGANASGTNRLAHAEMNAMAQVPENVDRERCEIYSTLEPCPMCTGAIRMMQLRAVHFAARDPGAGSTDWLSANDFMREIPCAVNGPADPNAEHVSVALLTEYRSRTGHPRWSEQWRDYRPEAFAAGEVLAQRGAFQRWRNARTSAQEIYDEVTSTRG